MAKIELKPCPFCGSKKLYAQDVGVEGEFEDWGIGCHSCGVFVCCSKDGEISTKFEIAKLWNRRTEVINVKMNGNNNAFIENVGTMTINMK